jgi:hypothetical protein
MKSNTPERLGQAFCNKYLPPDVSDPELFYALGESAEKIIYEKYIKL